MLHRKDSEEHLALRQRSKKKKKNPSRCDYKDCDFQNPPFDSHGLTGGVPLSWLTIQGPAHQFGHTIC